MLLWSVAGRFCPYFADFAHPSRQRGCRGACQVSELLESLTQNLAATRLQEILQQDIRPLRE